MNDNTTNTLTIIEPAAALATAQRLDENPAAVYLAQLGSPASRRVMLQALDKIAGLVSDGQHKAQSFPWGGLRFQHTQAIRARLTEQYAPATVNKMLSALRGVLERACDLGYMTPDEHRLAAKIKGVKSTSLPAGRELPLSEIQSLAEACKRDKTPAGARDLAMFGVMYACGVRRAELVAFDLADFDLDTGKLIVRSGKGRKSRTVYVSNGAKTALEIWLIDRGTQPGPLFFAIGRGSKRWGQRLSTQAVYNMLKARAKQSGVKDFSPHDMRRTFVSDMLDRGADIATVAKLAGHASVTTTARYDRRAEETKRKAASLLHFPV